MHINIKNWDKYNPRKDLKSLTWLRLDSDIGFSESLFGLSAESKWFWIFLLSFSAKKNKSSLVLDFDYISYHASVKKENISKHIESFIQKGLIELIQELPEHERICTDAGENVSYERTNERNEHVVNERTNARVDSSIDDIDICLDSPITEHPLDIKCDAKQFKPDLEFLYAEYPKKEGKKKAFERLSRIIKSQDVYENILLAIRNYSKQCNGKERQFIKQFSSFVSVWEDYLESQTELDEDDINCKVDWSQVEGDPYLKQRLEEVMNG